MKYIINGGKKLSGKVSISGNKNSVFPTVAAALLTDEEIVLENVPRIDDTQFLLEILRDIGVEVKWRGSVLSIKAHSIQKTTLLEDLVSKLRGSIVLSGALLGRVGRVSFHHPGGDVIGRRSIETHLEGFKKLGATVKETDVNFFLDYQDGRRDGEVTIFLQESSITACENLILAAVVGEKKVILKNCPTEPHVLDLCKMLLKMGADIAGTGGNTLVIKGVKKLSGCRFKIGTDFVEMGTYIITAAITFGRVEISIADDTDLDPIVEPLRRFGVKIECQRDKLIVDCDRLTSVPKLTTNLWPGFPTDLMSAAIVLATQSKGITLCHDWMYESRMFFVDKLISMGAKITLADPHRVLVYGPTKLKARVLDTPDIRAGMALVLASLTAKGISIINQAELIERGYENVVGKLKGLGADIERVS